MEEVRKHTAGGLDAKGRSKKVKLREPKKRKMVCPHSFSPENL